MFTWECFFWVLHGEMLEKTAVLLNLNSLWVGMGDGPKLTSIPSDSDSLSLASVPTSWKSRVSTERTWSVPFPKLTFPQVIYFGNQVLLHSLVVLWHQVLCLLGKKSIPSESDEFFYWLTRENQFQLPFYCVVGFQTCGFWIIIKTSQQHRIRKHMGKVSWKSFMEFGFAHSSVVNLFEKVLNSVCNPWYSSCHPVVH